MNQDLENIRKFIEQASDLPAGEKSRLLESMHHVDSELARQIHELQLEDSLEKVRASALRMKAISDLPAICEILFVELRTLGFNEIRNAMINIYDDTESFFYNNDYSDAIGQTITRILYNTHPVIEKQVKQIRSSVNAFSESSFRGRELEEWKDFRRSLGEKDDPRLENATELHYYFYSVGTASIGISTFYAISEEKQKALRRFRNVFEFAYRRYLDVAEAAAQARDALVELALERVRARTLAMQKSEELLETSRVLFHQLKELGEPADQLTIGIVNEAENVVEVSATLRGNILQQTMKHNIDEPIVMKKIADAWRAGQKTLILETKGRELEIYNRYRNKMVGSEMFPVKLNDDDRRIIQVAFFPKGLLALGTNDPRPRESLQLLARFASVFELTYTRFLDLQKAEAQAREAQIEASLERVRAKAMGMHTSSDLDEAAGTVFTELKRLGIHPIRSGFVLLTPDSRKAKLYPATTFDKENTVSIAGEFEFTGHPVFEKQYESWQKKENYFPVLEGELLTSYYKILSEGLSVPYENFPTDKKQFGCFLPFSAGFMFTWSLEPYAENEPHILNRFKQILDLTIRRYLDLQTSELQAREARIEAALERVRAKAMAMQNSDDMAAAVAVVFDELEKLNLDLIRCGIGILNREKRTAEVWTTGISQQGGKAQVSGDESLDIHPLLQGAYNAWLKQQDFSYELKGEDFRRYYRALEKTNFHLPEAHAWAEQAQPEAMEQFYFVTPFEAGNLFAFRSSEFPEEAKKVIRRFAEVFHLTYTRFLDLKKAEAQAREAQLERKRSEDLLLNILPLEIANELKQFGKSYARKHREVSILFADIKGFSSISEILSAEELVNQLDECFRAFDNIVTKHGLEKIKTIGDAYVCACGLPNPDPENAAKTVRAALDMLEFSKGFGMTKKIQNLPVFNFRFGIHTGPVITGVVGLKKFTYDIWGDAVNMAARMEQHGEAGRINISGNTWQLIKEKFRCTHRGKIEAKNKGEVDMYFVEEQL